MLSLTPGSYLCTYVFDFLTSFNDFFFAPGSGACNLCRVSLIVALMQHVSKPQKLVMPKPKKSC